MNCSGDVWLADPTNARPVKPRLFEDTQVAPTFITQSGLVTRGHPVQMDLLRPAFGSLNKNGPIHLISTKVAIFFRIP